MLSKVYMMIILLTSMVVCQTALAAPKDDIDKLRSFQRAMSDLGNEFAKLNNRYLEAQDSKSAEVATTLQEITLLTKLQLEPLEYTVVDIGLLQCDKASQNYFRQLVKDNF